MTCRHVGNVGPVLASGHTTGRRQQVRFRLAGILGALGGLSVALVGGRNGHGDASGSVAVASIDSTVILYEVTAVFVA